MRFTNPFPILAVVFIASLFISVFILPLGYTYHETCPKCQGEGTVTCETCHGSGKCWICDGTGKIWYMDDGWCGACQGTGKCYTCGGDGWQTCETCFGSGLLVHWMYTVAGSTVVISIISVLLFLGLFALSYMVTAFHLSFNEWVYEVNDMGFWFNPSFMTWLFARHPKRWVKWETPLNLIGAICLGATLFGIISLKQITLESFVTGTLFSVIALSLFSLIFYKSYTSRLETSP